jgi:hypothetical protein
MANPTSFNSWWGRQTIPVDRTDFWQIGPLKLWLRHLPFQWQISWSQGPDWLDTRVRYSAGSQDEQVPSGAHSSTFAFGNGDRTDLLFTPILCNRSLTTRTPQGFQVLPGEEVNIFVLSPLAVKIEMTNPEKSICEIPTYRLSDTWLGPISIASGEIAYSGNGPVYLNLRDVPLRLHCAITAVNIRNSRKTTLKLDRVNVPLTRLSLFYSSRTGFWTNSIGFECGDNGALHGADMNEVRIHPQPPPEANPSQMINGPGTATESASVGRAFTSFLRERGL